MLSETPPANPSAANGPDRDLVLYRLLKYVLLGPALQVLGRPRTSGLHHIPRSGGAILASNHLAVIDSFYLALRSPRPIYYLTKQEYFDGDGLRGAMARRVLKAVNQIPVDRSDGDRASAALSKAADVVRSGRIWGIYPEGTRSPDGRLYRGRTGVARVAAMTGAPVVPVAMLNTRAANPPGSRMIRPVRVGIRVGAPLHFPETSSAHPPTQAALRSFTDALMLTIEELGGQEYVDEYAQRSPHQRRMFR